MIRHIITILITGGAFACASPPDGPFQPDEFTLLLAHFDRHANADHALGVSLADGGGIATAGKFGGALHVGGRESIAFDGRANFPRAEGCIEFWLQPSWNGADGRVRQILDAGSNSRDKVSINKLANGRLGIGMFGTPAGSTNFVYSRADRDIRAWASNSWHHIAACWQNDELALWLDGEKVASRKGALPPQTVPDLIRIQSGDFAIDELCISSIARYTARGRAGGRAVAPRTQLGHGWKFNEPPGIYRCTPPTNATAAHGVIVLPKNYLDEIDPARLPAPGKSAIELAGCPGEIEPASFILIATEPLADVSLRASALTSDTGSIPADCLIIRQVVRTPMRKIYTAKRNETDIANRFLPRWQIADIPAHEFREVWLECRLPGDAKPGRYSGSISITHKGGSQKVPLAVDVLPIRLLDHPVKALATYYRLGRTMRDKDRALRELRDMRDHGIRHLVSHLAIQYQNEAGDIRPDLGELRDGLELLRSAGFQGAKLVVDTSFPTLARMLGHQDLGRGDGASLDGDTEFSRIAKSAMDAFVQLQRQTSDFYLFATHLDEVFGNRPLLDQYIRLSRAARQIPAAKLYITFHTLRDQNDAWRKEFDPFVDLRCNHGYSFEQWLARGHTIDEYEQELNSSGDEAWFYHNARGTYWTAEWSRIINGIFLWAGPFSAHCPWTYQAYFENPYDDTDGPESKGHDWGLSFPGSDDPAELVPTRCYEAMREGGDDLRYIATLENAIEAASPRDPRASAESRRFLDDLKAMIRRAKTTGPMPAATPSPASGAIDADTGLIMGQGAIGTPGESPLTHALATRFDGDHWQSLRRDIAQRIIKLQEATRHE